eukprot:TRINITY_DN17071_c0_g2_i3.p1 TRINITY_DN17071_c0_g2~~TRINITY_DN17071_c0_g2_i3.p1  ORF type:complete len:105 (+),score=16.98 TRINITY_DN17071_c0_g2_i3:846-1160(+)
MNCIGNKGCLSLADNTPDSLKALILRNNRVQDSACQALSSLVKNSPSLTNLNLELNFISDGCVDLIKAAVANKNIRYLDLSGNVLTDHPEQVALLSNTLCSRRD